MASTALQIGFIGEEVGCILRQGGTFGVFTAYLANPDDVPNPGDVGAPIDLTGAVIRASVRQTPNGPVKTTFNVLLDADPTTGKFQFWLTATQTAALKAGPTIKDDASKYLWDMILQTGDIVTPLYYGTFSVYRGITPPPEPA